MVDGCNGTEGLYGNHSNCCIRIHQAIYQSSKKACSQAIKNHVLQPYYHIVVMQCNVNRIYNGNFQAFSRPTTSRHFLKIVELVYIDRLLETFEIIIIFNR